MRTGLDEEFTQYMSRIYGLKGSFQLSDNDFNILAELGSHYADCANLQLHEAFNAIVDGLQSGQNVHELATMWGMSN